MIKQTLRFPFAVQNGRGLTIRLLLAAMMAAFLLPLPLSGQTTTINANNLVHRSNGALRSPSAWRLDENGFLGTFITVAGSNPVAVTFTVSASKSSNDSGTPQMRLRVADFSQTWSVTAIGNSYANHVQTWTLPPGTYPVRMEYINRASSLQLNIASLTITGASVANAATDSNALAAADTYIANYRKGPATLTLTAGGQPLANTQVRVRLKRHAFNFGTAVYGAGTGDTDWIRGASANAVNYRNFLNANFNTIVPENAGKWPWNEATRDVVTMGNVDAMLDYAEAHGMRARMHGVLWDYDEPAWVNDLQTLAKNGDTVAKDDLRGEVTERIGYFVGGANGSTRATRYIELDGINEDWQRSHLTDGSQLLTYSALYGTSGVAGIYNEIQSAMTAVGSSAKTYTNEYNVLQWSSEPNYGNWYRQYVESIVNAGGSLGGIGIQYYANYGLTDPWNVHSPARMLQIFNNLGVTGLPISLTEFGVMTTNSPTQQQAANLLSDTVRMVFGHPDMRTFMSWGFWKPAMWATEAAMVDADWNLTIAGKTWQQMMGVQDWGLPNVPVWTTDVTLTTNASGQINLPAGFYGDYEVTVPGGAAGFTLQKGATAYSVAVPLKTSSSANGVWNTPATWTNGVPVSGGAAGVIHTVTFQAGDSWTGGPAEGLLIGYDSWGANRGLSGSGSGTLNVTGGNLTTGCLGLGAGLNGGVQTGTLNISGGTVTANDAFLIGWSGAAGSSVNVSGGILNLSGNGGFQNIPVDNFSFESPLGAPGSEATNWATTSWGTYPYTPPYLTPTNGTQIAYSNTGGGTLTQILDAYQLGSGDQVRLRIDFGWPSHTAWSGASVSVSSVNGPNGTVLMGTFDAAQPPLGGWNTLAIPLTVNPRQAGGFLQVTITNSAGIQTVIDNVRAEVVSAVSSASSMNVIGGAMNVTGGTVNLGRPLAFNNTSTFSIGGTGLVNLNSGGILSASPTIQSGGTLKFNGGGGNPANNLFVQGGAVDVNGQTLPAGTWGNYLSTADGNRILNSSAAPAVIADGNTLWLWNTPSMTTTIETIGDLTIDSWITGSSGHNGGITKTGPGMLTLTNPSSDYTGHTVVNVGTLRLNQLRLADSADVRISSGARLNLNFSGTDAIRSLYINGVKQAGGTWGAPGSGAQNKSDLITGGGMLLVSAGAKYADWANDNGIPGEPATDDHDGDGIKNLAEYALGTDPVVASGSPVTMVETTVSYPKGAAAVANGDVGYVIETSTTLAAGSWTAVTPAVNNSALISYTLPPGAERFFARLKVDLAP